MKCPPPALARQPTHAEDQCACLLGASHVLSRWQPRSQRLRGACHGCARGQVVQRWGTLVSEQHLGRCEAALLLGHLFGQPLHAPVHAVTCPALPSPPAMALATPAIRVGRSFRLSSGSRPPRFSAPTPPAPPHQQCASTCSLVFLREACRVLRICSPPPSACLHSQ